MQDVQAGPTRRVRSAYSHVACFCAFAGLVAAWPVTAAAGAFLNLDGILGESTAEGHKDEIVVLSYDLSMVVPPSNSGRPLSTLICPPVGVMKNLDAASAILAKKLVQGVHIPRAVLTLQREGANPFDYFVLTMDEVFIYEFSHVSGTDPGRVVEKVVFVARKYGLEYRKQDGTGNVSTIKSSWDCKTAQIT